MFARVRPYLSTALLSLLILYFGVNALMGERGFLTRHERDAALAQKSAALSGLVAERRDLEVRTRLLGDRNLSKDLLEERARVLLGFSDPRDYVIRVARPTGANRPEETPAGG